MLLAGGQRGLDAIVASQIIVATPFGLLMVAIAWSLFKALRYDYREERRQLQEAMSYDQEAELRQMQEIYNPYGRRDGQQAGHGDGQRAPAGRASPTREEEE
jgi:choline-glycine betaine transporter